MTRHATALKSIGSGNSLAATVEALLFAVREAEVENKDPSSDAAVMLLGSQVAFMTHADVTTGYMFETLIDSCESKSNEALILSVEAH